MSNPNVIVDCFCGREIRNGYQHITREFALGVRSHISAHRREGWACYWNQEVNRVELFGTESGTSVEPNSGDTQNTGSKPETDPN